jgi:hypothetical protein
MQVPAQIYGQTQAGALFGLPCFLGAKHPAFSFSPGLSKGLQEGLDRRALNKGKHSLESKTVQALDEDVLDSRRLRKLMWLEIPCGAVAGHEGWKQTRQTGLIGAG